MASQLSTINSQLLQQHFDTLAETPDAVAKLRGFVRDLAVRGCLVPQSNKDESAKELLKRIVNEKRGLAREGVGKDTPILEPITSDDCPFMIPKNWAWVKTQDVTTYVQRGKSPKYSLEKKIPVIAQKCIQWHGFELHKAQFIEPESLESYSEDRFVQNGDLLWNSTGLGTLGRIIVFKERYKEAYPQIVADSHITVIRPSKFVVPDYLFCWFAGPKVQNEINAKASGSTKQTELATSTVLSYAIPLPPLAEQRRIVAKVEELLALCDELEAAQTAAREHRTRLVRSALDYLTTGVRPSPGAATSARTEVSENSNARRPPHAAAPEDGRTPDAFQQHAAFVLQHSALVLDSVSDLRQAINSLAVQGHVVPHANGDTEIREIKFEEIIEDSRYGTAKKCHYQSEGTPVLRIPNVVSGKIDLSDLKRTELTKKEKADLGLQKGNLLIVRSNGSVSLVGRAAVVTEECAGSAFAGYLVRVRLRLTEANPEFVQLALSSSLIRQQIEMPIRTTSGVKNINTQEIYRLTIPFPPLAEQKRIVAKVDELMRWCDALEARLTAAQNHATHLLDATLHQILTA